MTRTGSEMKSLIEEWTKQWGYTLLDTSGQKGHETFEWVLEIKNLQHAVLVYSQKNSDIIKFQTNILFIPEHQEKTGQMDNEQFNTFILDVTDRLTYFGCDWNFQNDAQIQKNFPDYHYSISVPMTVQIRMQFYKCLTQLLSNYLKC